MMVLRWFASQWLVSVALVLYFWAGWAAPDRALQALQSGAGLLLSVLFAGLRCDGAGRIGSGVDQP